MFVPEQQPELLKPHQFVIGVFAVIFDSSKRVLLCHRTDMDLWNLPAGGMEPNETPWGAAVREVEEETGLQVEIEQLFGVYSRPNQNEVAFGFLCRVVGGNLKCTDEADCVEYFDLDKIPSNTHHEQAEALQDAVVAEETLVSLRLQANPSPREVYFRGLC